MDQREVVVTRGLEPDAMDVVRALRQVCEAVDGSDLKLELNRAASDGAENTVLVRERGRLVGYVGVDSGRDAEVCGMVHPEFRAHRIGTILLARALDIARGSGRASVLVICEDATPVAQAWLTRRGATLAMSEHRMIATLDASVDEAASLLLRQATPGDVPAVQHILRDGFPSAGDNVEQEFAGARARVLEETFVGEVDGDIVGTLRVTPGPPRPMIYGLVIERSLRGRRLGTMMLRSVMRHIRDTGEGEVGLEVETENVPALRLYAAAGFRTVTTYRYMRLSV